MRLWWLSICTLAAACDGGEGHAPDSGVDPVADAAMEPVDAGFSPHEVDCPDEVRMPAIVAGTATRASARCTIVSGPPDVPATIERVEVAMPFLAVLASSGPAEAVIELEYAPTSTKAEDDVAEVTIYFTSEGVERTGRFRVTGRALPPYTFDPPPPPVVCRADGEAPVLDAALALTSLDRDSFGFTNADLMESGYYAGGYLGDEFLLSWFVDARARPARAGCLEGELAGPLDQFMSGPHPASNAILHAARLLDRPPIGARPIDPRLTGDSFDDALALLCDYVPRGCGMTADQMPEELGRAIAPLVYAILEGLIARYSRDGAAIAPHDTAWWTRYGGNGLLISTVQEFYDPLDAADRAFLLGEDRDRLYGAAARIAYAVEMIDWSAFRGRAGVAYELETGAGWIVIKDSAADIYLEDGRPILLLIDLGGDDTHLDDVASNRSSLNAVSVAIDLGGDDRYAYEEVATIYDRPGLAPADDGLRYRGDDSYGNISFSTHFRQGAARNGIAMLFDLGGGRDRYQTLIGGQGYAHQGVGVLLDDGGDDVYVAESAAQGSAQFGIGLLLDGGGNDDYRAFSYAQGFGYAGGAGFLADMGGNDKYSCDHGDPTRGGIALYYSPQLPGTGNTSMCQGAGFGRRGQAAGTFFSGGVGVLRDHSGDDSYEASVFAQGTGYWQGTGVLSDGDGSDHYDAFWYVQGGAAHYAIAVLADAGTGANVFCGTLPAINVHLGAGHDYSIGVLLEEAGSSEYHASSLSLGASNCNGVGMFVDNAGDDRYFAVSMRSSGLGNTSEECVVERPNARSIGLMIEAGGADEYNYPMSMITVPSEGGTWGHAGASLMSEHGAGIDTSGETGTHAESGR